MAASALTPEDVRLDPGQGQSLGFEHLSTMEIIERVTRGFDYAAVESLRRHLDLSLEEMADLLRIPGRTLARRKGRWLRQDESERLLSVSRAYEHALAMFREDVAAARRWMKTPARALGGKTPLEMCRTEPGAREVEDLVGRIRHGVFS